MFLLIFVPALIIERKAHLYTAGLWHAHCWTRHTAQWQQEVSTQVHLRLPWRGRLPCWSSHLSAKTSRGTGLLPELHSVCILTDDALGMLCNCISRASKFHPPCTCDGRCARMQSWGPWVYWESFIGHHLVTVSTERKKSKYCKEEKQYSFNYMLSILNTRKGCF